MGTYRGLWLAELEVVVIIISTPVIYQLLHRPFLLGVLAGEDGRAGLLGRRHLVERGAADLGI